MRTFLLRGIPLALWMGVIFLFSSLPGSPYPSDPPLWYYLERKGAHVFEYAILLIFAMRFFFIVFPREAFPKVLLLASIFSIAYAASDELHQFLVPYRGARMNDVLIDGTSILFVASLLFFIYRRRSILRLLSK